uniref:Olfactory receptor n=1 Tax=Leptobrachium leishanense TaxID=445787 RepID=A0A8C5MA65_9ANUR
MNLQNHTSVTEFFLLGFQDFHNFKIPLFVLLLVLYLVIINGNIFIVLIVSTCRVLHSPMYFFLFHLSLSDILFTTNIVPNMLNVILEEGSTISYPGCFFQLYLFEFSGNAECYILTVMSLDRYLAICKPLHYSTIMNFKLCFRLVISAWSLSFSLSLISVLLINNLHFCKYKTIDHFFCDIIPVVELSCSDTSIVEIEAFFAVVLIAVLPFVFVVVTYVCIFVVIFAIPTTTGRKKAFSTCSSHLAIVCMFYGTLIGTYLTPYDGESLTIKKFTSLLYTMMTPLFNPIIYTLKNKEIQKACRILCKENGWFSNHFNR